MATSIHQPKPTLKATAQQLQSNSSSSNRLLSSHHSVLDLLHQKPYAQNCSPAVSSTPRYSPIPNVDLHLSAVSSWQSIGDYLSSRPTSSVLSNSDTEDDATDGDKGMERESSTDSAIHVSRLAAPDSAFYGNVEEDDGDSEDEKTIEISMNQGRTSRKFPSTLAMKSAASVSSSSSDSGFVMPEFSSAEFVDALRGEGNDHMKILIIGRKKSKFLRSMDKNLSKKFTLDVEDSYNTILVIFDGLIKIGNILNFIKKKNSQNRDKLFIPIYKNIDQRVVNKLLQSHRLNLLCPPINYENEMQIDNLMELLNQDFLIHKSFYSTTTTKSLTYDHRQFSELANLKFPQRGYQLISLQGDTDSQVLSESIVPKSSVFVKHFNPCEISGHHMNKNQQNRLALRPTHSSSVSSKKKRPKKQDQSYFVYLSVTLSLGIGIGISTAFAISHISNSEVIEEHDSVNPLLITNSVGSTGHMLKKSVELMKGNLIVFKQSVGEISKLMWKEVRTGLETMAYKWDKWIVNVGVDPSNTMLWYF